MFGYFICGKTANEITSGIRVPLEYKIPTFECYINLVFSWIAVIIYNQIRSKFSLFPIFFLLLFRVCQKSFKNSVKIFNGYYFVQKFWTNRRWFVENCHHFDCFCRFVVTKICAYTDVAFEEVSLFNKMFYIFMENLHFLLF